MNIRTIITMMLLSIPYSSVAQETSSNAIKSQTLVAHWSCMVYSNYTEDKESAELHFEAGLSDGKLFVADARNGTLTQHELLSSAPYLVVSLLQGPSDDFVLGRLFEGIRDYAYEKVARKAETGHDSLHFETDPELLRIKSQNIYRSSNCQLLN